LVDKLVDDMGTVCFNLIDDLKIVKPNQPTGSEISKPSWMPTVKIETVTKSVEQKPVATAVKPSDDKPHPTDVGWGCPCPCLNSHHHQILS